MNKTYFLLATHFLACIILFTAIPYFLGTNTLPYGLIAVCFFITVFLTGILFIRYPSERLNPFTLLSLIYSLQFSVSLFLIKYHKIISRNALLRYYNNIDENNLVDAMRLAYIFSFVALCIAFIFSKSAIWNKIQSRVRKALIEERRLLTFFLMGITFIEFMLIAGGKVTLQGESLVGKDIKNIEVNPLVAIVNPIACLAVFLSAYQYSTSRHKQLIVLLLVQFVWFFLWGRRQIVFFAFLAFVGFYYDKKIILNSITAKGLQKVVLAGVALFVVMTAAQFYQQLRTIGGVKVLQNVSIQSLQKVVQMYKTSDSDELRHASDYNIELRALSTVAAVAHYDKLIESGGIQKGNGLEIYNNFLKATPSSYFVDKSSVLVMEALASKLTNGRVKSSRDLGGTLILESMVDFGRLGVVLYPIFMALLITLFYWFLLKTGSPMVILWAVITLLYSILSMVEGNIGDMFLAMRSTLLVLFIMAVIWFLRKVIKSHSVVIAG